MRKLLRKLLSKTDFQPSSIAWLTWISLLGLLTGGFALGYPAFLQSSAYDFARDLFLGSFQLMGALFLLSGLLCLGALFHGRRIFAIVGLGLSMWLQLVFGISIFALTLDGTVSAIAGSFQWWTSVAVSAYILVRGV